MYMRCIYSFIEWDVKMCYNIPGTVPYVVESVMEYGEEDGIFNAV